MGTLLNVLIKLFLILAAVVIIIALFNLVVFLVALIQQGAQ